jgi:NAD(P)H-dependent FMN reductase
MKLQLIAASHRTDSINLRLLNITSEIMQAINPEIQMINIPYSELDLPLYNDNLRINNALPEKLSDVNNMLSEADGYMLAVPEYNWSYPASIKNLIDWLSCLPRSPFKNKPAFLMCATPSERGGMMCLNHLKVVLEYMGMLPYPIMFGLGKVDALATEILSSKQQQQLSEQLKNFNNFAQKLSK